MSDWTSPENRARLRARVPDLRCDDAHAVAETMPAVLDALEAAERERDLYRARLRAAHGALADAADASPTPASGGVCPGSGILSPRWQGVTAATEAPGAPVPCGICGACIATDGYGYTVTHARARGDGEPLTLIDAEAERLDPGHLLRVNADLRLTIGAVERVAADVGWRKESEEPLAAVLRRILWEWGCDAACSEGET